MNVTSFEVRAFTQAQAADWSRFVAGSRNGTFLFDRRYMDYHHDRFVDASLTVWKGQELIGLFPASRHGDEIVSHGGLSYGGLIIGDNASAASVLEMYAAIVETFRSGGAARLRVKVVPRIYQRLCCDEEAYALFRLGFHLVRRDVAATVDLRAERRPKLTKGRKWGLNRARKLGYVVEESREFSAFMALEAEVLQRRHDVTPVHSPDEMERLAAAFPQNIRLFVARMGDGALDAGVLVYDSGTVAHAQYIAATERAHEACATDLIIDTLINSTFASRHYFDFGISTTEAGRSLNSGLAAYKESFGARSTVCDFYELELRGGT